MSTEELSPAGDLSLAVVARERPRFQFLRNMAKIKMAWFATIVLGLTIFVAAAAPWISPYDPIKNKPNDSLDKPSANHLLGADQLGRDQLSRLFWGARVSLIVGVLAVGIGAGIGIILGILSAYFRGITDDIIMRFMDAIMSIPGLVLALALLAAFGSGIFTVSVAIAIGWVPSIARLIRSQALAVMETDYITASRAIGAQDFRIMFRHVMPNCIAPVWVQASLGMGITVIMEASLSFLGVGLTPPTPTWGNMLYTAFERLVSAPWLSFAPGICIFLLVLACNFLGDALRDTLDPRLRGKI